MPKELALAAAKGRVESTIRGYVSILRDARFPTNDSQAQVMNDAIKWVRKNHAIMDSMSQAEALASIMCLARSQETDPVEAGLAIKLLYGTDTEGLRGVLSKFRHTLEEAMTTEWLLNLDKMVASKHFGLLCAAMGDTNAMRMVMFWADQALDADERTPDGRKVADNLADVPTKAVRINLAYREAVNRMGGELGKLRAEGTTVETHG